jgi:hypothetical protein
VGAPGRPAPPPQAKPCQPPFRPAAQECFGLRDTPLLGGPARVPLLLELLSPAGRPLQVRPWGRPCART